MQIIKYNGRVIREKRFSDNTTRWVSRVKCRLGCCESNIIRGTLEGIKRHLDYNELKR